MSQNSLLYEAILYVEIWLQEPLNSSEKQNLDHKIPQLV